MTARWRGGAIEILYGEMKDAFTKMKKNIYVEYIV